MTIVIYDRLIFIAQATAFYVFFSLSFLLTPVGDSTINLLRAQSDPVS